MQPILEMRNITKTFPGVKALTDVNLNVLPAEIHAVVGENGAGKSTLMKVLSGVYPSGTFDGEILFEGKPQNFRAISDSEHTGIVIIHQELALVPLLSIAENIFLGQETARHGVINWFEAFARTKELLKKVGLNEHPNTLITNIGTGKQQLVEIAKALNKKVKLLILDEPTSSLNETDSNALLELLKGFKAQGISSILITHKLNEVLKVADRITVIRDGKTVDTLDTRTAKVSEDRIIKAMVGRELSERYPPRDAKIGEYHSRSEELECLSSVALRPADDQEREPDRPRWRSGRHCRPDGGRAHGICHVALWPRLWAEDHGRSLSCMASSWMCRPFPRRWKRGLAYATEDRKTYGLVLIDHIKHNITLANLDGVSTRGVAGRSRGTARGQPLPQGSRHPQFLGLSDHREPLWRQPAKGCAVEMAVLRARRVDPG